MNRKTYIRACLIIIFAFAVMLTGCGRSATDTTASSDENKQSSTSQNTTDIASTDDMSTERTPADSGSSTDNTSSTQLATPFVECDSVLEAAELTGFPMDGPEDIDSYSLEVILAYTDPASPMIEMRYKKGEDTISLRKAPSSLNEDDISGNYNDYSETTTITNKTTADITALAYGADGLFYKMTWKRDTYVYSMSSTAGIETEIASTLLDRVF